MPGPDETRRSQGRRRLERLSTTELAQRITSTSIVVQPVGAVEQHGPHLPLGTDLILSEALADTAVDRCGDELDVWRLPALAYTKSNEHAWAAGTIWLSAAAMGAVLDDLGRSIAAMPARTLVFLNAHGGNAALLEMACRELRLAHGLATYLVQPTFGRTDLSAPDSEEGAGIHAGYLETSLMLHLEPELVAMELARRDVPSTLQQNQRVRFGGTVAFGWTSDDFTTSGVIGDPTGATAAAGREAFGHLVSEVIAALGEIAALTKARANTATS